MALRSGGQENRVGVEAPGVKKMIDRQQHQKQRHDYSFISARGDLSERAAISAAAISASAKSIGTTAHKMRVEENKPRSSSRRSQG
jgi:hypothetical protein